VVAVAVLRDSPATNLEVFLLLPLFLCTRTHAEIFLVALSLLLFGTRKRLEYVCLQDFINPVVERQPTPGQKA